MSWFILCLAVLAAAVVLLLSARLLHRAGHRSLVADRRGRAGALR